MPDSLDQEQQTSPPTATAISPTTRKKPTTRAGAKPTRASTTSTMSATSASSKHTTHRHHSDHRRSTTIAIATTSISTESPEAFADTSDTFDTSDTITSWDSDESSSSVAGMGWESVDQRGGRVDISDTREIDLGGDNTGEYVDMPDTTSEQSSSVVRLEKVMDSSDTGFEEGGDVGEMIDSSLRDLREKEWGNNATTPAVNGHTSYSQSYLCTSGLFAIFSALKYVPLISSSLPHTKHPN